MESSRSDGETWWSDVVVPVLRLAPRTARRQLRLIAASAPTSSLRYQVLCSRARILLSANRKSVQALRELWRIAHRSEALPAKLAFQLILVSLLEKHRTRALIRAARKCIRLFPRDSLADFALRSALRLVERHGAPADAARLCSYFHLTTNRSPSVTPREM